MATEEPLPDESRFDVPIRDPVWKHIWLTAELREITLSAPFLRLYRIKQLGPAEYVYPGATHTRAAHSLGVYWIALRMLRVLISRGARDWVTPRGCASFLVTALLHDLGHFPFTHALKELPLQDHESLTAALLGERDLPSLISAAGGDATMAARIIDKSLPLGPDDASETAFFRRLLSGVLDPDKIDYLNRDAYYCGVPYGLQDTEFILSRILPDRERGIVVDSRALLSIETILFSKYLMYRAVYWHRQVRIATAMMKKALFAALRGKLIAAEDLYGLDDRGIYDLIGSLDFPERELATAISGRAFFQVVAEIGFTANNPRLAALENLADRSLAESSLAAYLSGALGEIVPDSRVLIDLPENVTFESDLFVRDELRPFSDSSTVFSRDVVDRFTGSLRVLRLALHPSLAESARRLGRLDEKLAECLKEGYTL